MKARSGGRGRHKNSVPALQSAGTPEEREGIEEDLQFVHQEVRWEGRKVRCGKGKNGVGMGVFADLGEVRPARRAGVPVSIPDWFKVFCGRAGFGEDAEEGVVVVDGVGFVEEEDVRDFAGHCSGSWRSFLVDRVV